MSDSQKPNKPEVLPGEEALLLDHDYDGIQELNHPLPSWWLGVLYATIIFGAWYMGYYMSGLGPNPRQELAIVMKEIEAAKPVQAASSNDEEQELMAAFKNPESVKAGSAVFAGKCLACHGDHGQGLVGPNLTDEYWLHGTGSLKDISSVVATGVAEKGMPPWGPVLKHDELINVVAYVRSLRGTNPAGAKPAQGNKQEYKD